MYIVVNSCSIDTAFHQVYVKSPAQCFVKVDPLSMGSQYISIYPNPTSGSFIVELPVDVNDGEIYVTDITGKIITKGLMNKGGNKVVFTLPDVASGTYFVKVESDGIIYREKITVIK